MELKRYIFFPAGRSLWFELALRLEQDGVAKPIAWVGDPIHDVAASDAFPDCLILNFERANLGLGFPPFEFSAKGELFLHEQSYLRIKDRALKLMGRHDPYGAYRYLDKEVFLNKCLAFCLSYLGGEVPDFILLAEAPHSPFQYILFEVANFLQIPVLCFQSWSIAPVLVLRRGIDGPAVPKAGMSPISDMKLIEGEISKFFERFNNCAEDLEPTYMKRQREVDSRRLRVGAKRVLNLLRKVRNAQLTKDTGLERGLLSATKFHVLEPVIAEIMTSGLKKEIKHRLVASEEEVDLHGRQYVYFPLHYEPERTTMPDGMEFYDQFRAILALRFLVPNVVPIYVKEHYSQFTSTLQGHKGRGLGFYELLRSVSNLVIVPSTYNSRDMIRNSCLTATITGSAALEASCLRVPSLVFGNPWFKGAPGVFSYSRGLRFEDMVSAEQASIADLERWAIEAFRCFGVFGCVNPSNELLYRAFFEIGDMVRSELESVVALVKDGIAQEVSITTGLSNV